MHPQNAFRFVDTGRDFFDGYGRRIRRQDTVISHQAGNGPKDLVLELQILKNGLRGNPSVKSGTSTPSRRRSYGNDIASMAWGARNLISTRVYGYLDHDVELRRLLRKGFTITTFTVMIPSDGGNNRVPLEGVHPSSFYFFVEVPGHVRDALR